MADVNEQDALGDHPGGVTFEPEDVVVGVVPRGGDAGGVVDELVKRDVAQDRIHVLEGADGRETLKQAEPSGAQKLVSWLSDADEMRQQLDDALAEGHAVVTVSSVDHDHEQSMRKTLAEVGLEDIHFFGKWESS